MVVKDKATAQPDYMKQFGGEGTWKAPAGGASKVDFMQYYKVGKKLDVDEKSSMTALLASLSGLDEAYGFRFCFIVLSVTTSFWIVQNGGGDEGT